VTNPEQSNQAEPRFNSDQLEAFQMLQKSTRHYLTNDLGLVLGVAEMLHESPTLSEEDAEILNTLLGAARSLARRVEKLSRFDPNLTPTRSSSTGEHFNLGD
jgi:hypothetical protein